MKLKYLSFLLFLIIVSCTIKTSPPESQSAEISPISTEILNPEPIKIELESLPKPFASDSASQPPQILPIPSPRILNVPPGFQVNVYAEGLNNPRWLALTPDGDVLVTETRNNRITLLQDTDNNGVADVRTIFADQTNGLNIPFGMAFTEDYFFLGNHDAVKRYDYPQGQTRLQGQGISIASLPGEVIVNIGLEMSSFLPQKINYMFPSVLVLMLI